MKTLAARIHGANDLREESLDLMARGKISPALMVTHWPGPRMLTKETGFEIAKRNCPGQ